MKQKIAVLQERLDELHRQIDRLEIAIEDKAEYRLAPGDAWVTRWELNRALVKRLRQSATSIEQALARIHGGTYGVCERCGRAIDPQRIVALPDARLCILCARADAQSGKCAFRRQ